MTKIMASLCVAAIVTFCGLAQSTSAQCPRLETSGNYTVMEGEMTTFSVSLNGGSQVAPKFNWVVSAGKITSGQGASVIKVDTTGTGGQMITATVEVAGLSASCTRIASVSSDIDASPQAKKVDEYGSINEEDEMARLDRFAIELQMEPLAQVYIVAYGSKKSKPAETNAAIERTRTYLVKTRGIESTRIVTASGGNRENPTYQLWLVPPRATPPDLTTKDQKGSSEKPKTIYI